MAQPKRRTNIFDAPAQLSGLLSFSTTRSGKRMVIFRLAGYDKPFYGFQTAPNILPSGKKSFRSTSFHVVRFPETDDCNSDTVFCGALWERFSARREKQRLTDPSLGPDKYRIRIDGDLQNYMAYEAPDYILCDTDLNVYGRVWKKISASGKEYLQISLNQQKREYLNVFPTAGAETAPIVVFTDSGSQKLGTATLNSSGALLQVMIHDTIYRAKSTSGQMLIFPTKKRLSKKKDYEVFRARKEEKLKAESLAANTDLTTKDNARVVTRRL